MTISFIAFKPRLWSFTACDYHLLRGWTGGQEPRRRGDGAESWIGRNQEWMGGQGQEPRKRGREVGDEG